MKVKQLISILLMLLLLTACSANTDLDLPDEAGSSEQTSNMDASAAEPEDGAEKPTLPEIETPEGAPDAELVETLLVTVVSSCRSFCPCGAAPTARKAGFSRRAIPPKRGRRSSTAAMLPCRTRRRPAISLPRRAARIGLP